MEATIASFRRSRHVQKPSHLILQVKGIENREKANSLVGKKVTWKSPAGKEIKGEVKAAHGNKGAVRAIFETGMPGQSLGSKVEIQ